MKAVAVILAAGEGAKVGVPEAILEYEKGKSFLRWLSSIFSKAGYSTLAVIRPGTQDIRDRHPDAWLVEVPADEIPLRAGIKAALDEGAEAVIIHPVEKPAVRASTVDKLVKSLEGSEGVVPDFEGALGQPMVLSRSAAEKVLQMDDPQLNNIARRLDLKKLPTRDPGVVVSIDTAEMYEKLLGSKPHAAPPPKKRGKSPEEEEAGVHQ